jgi:branched-subunit amino acid ABC-type transport system permease component
MDINPVYIVLTTVTLASIYGLLAIGISIIWSSLGMINMAHGFMFALAGYGGWMAAEVISRNGVVVMGAGILTGALAGIAIAAIAFLPLYDKPNFAIRSLIATLAVSLLGAQTLLYVFGPRVKALPKIFGIGGVNILGVHATYDKLGTIICAPLVLLAVLVWTRNSRRGLQIRAMMQNPEGAALVGVGLRSTAMSVMALTGGLCGLASVLLSQTYFVSPYSGLTPLLKGIIVALAGGLGSIPGALIAALCVGLVETLTAVTLGGKFVLITQFLFIIGVLLVRPRGIAGMLEQTRE